MKNLSELSDEQKSVMLARLHDRWDIVIGGGIYIPGNGGLVFDLYAEDMSLAWSLLNWAMDSDLSARAKADIMALFYVDKPSALEMSPAEAQRALLDKILSLADEAGLLEEQNANH